MVRILNELWKKINSSLRDLFICKCKHLVMMVTLFFWPEVKVYSSSDFKLGDLNFCNFSFRTENFNRSKSLI